MLKGDSRDIVGFPATIPVLPAISRLHAGRVVGRDRHHWHPHRAAAAGGATARESARRAHCVNNLTQLIIAVNNYEMAHGVYPPGTIADAGPVQSLPQGYHHNWISQILPFIEQRNAYTHINREFSVYHPSNRPVRILNIPILNCPSLWSSQKGYTSYAGVHHDVESPIDATNHGVFFLNSRIATTTCRTARRKHCLSARSTCYREISAGCRARARRLATRERR